MVLSAVQHLLQPLDRVRVRQLPGLLHPIELLHLEIHLAVGDPVILLYPLLPLVGVSIAMEKERQQNDGLVTG